MKVVVASDFHLKFDENNEDTIRKENVLTFLKTLKKNTDVLILNGDIFDLWLEWSSVIIKDYFPILKVLSDLSENNTRIILVSGNHDFWFHDFLTKYLKIEIFEDFFSETIDGKKYYVTHGDLHTVNDLRYHIYRKVIRSKIVKTIVSLLNPNITLRIGKKLSRSSRNREDSVELKNKKEKGLILTAEILSKDFDFIFMGHSHQPKLIQFNNSYYINTGDWLIHNSYCIIENQTPQLVVSNQTNRG